MEHVSVFSWLLLAALVSFVIAGSCARMMVAAKDMNATLADSIFGGFAIMFLVLSIFLIGMAFGRLTV